MKHLAKLVAAFAFAFIAGCHAPMSLLNSASEPAARVVHLTAFMLVLAAGVYAVVVVALGVAIRRNRTRAVDSVDMSTHNDRWIIAGGIVLPACILAVLFFVSLGAMGRVSKEPPAFTISVVGQQWWWQVRYHPDNLSGAFTTANEIHIPVGKQVRLLLTSADVIHSFWVPQLQGKLDVIPGDTNDLRLSADSPGVYRGKCAEFCGAQHTNMAIIVVAEDSAAFAAWEAAQKAIATAASDSDAAYGAKLFAAAPCAGCHTIRGTTSVGNIGPDLTHVASRMTIGAGVLPMQFGNLAGWIGNAPSIKPGVRMPRLTRYSGADLQALTRYVSGLR